MSHSAYTYKLACSLNDLRKENQLCDVVISVSGRDFNAHKNVLAACSSYFLAMFTSEFREASESKVNIDGKPEFFEAILDFVYTGTMKLSGETACELLEMACYMQLKEASQHIANFIHREISSSAYQRQQDIPIGEVYKISEMADCQEHLKFLVSVCEKHMYLYYKQLKASDVFLQHASVAFLMKLLTPSDLSRIVVQEKEVLELVVKWLKHDFENRREFAPSLLRKVRLGLVPEESRTELLSEEILGIPECKQIADSVASHQQSGISKSRLALMYPSLFSTRSTVTALVRAVVPEFQGTRPTSFEYFDMTEQLWKQIPSFAKLSRVPSLIVIDYKLHAIGGLELKRGRYSYLTGRYYDPEYTIEYSKDFEIYDAELNRWHQCPAMKYARAYPRLVYLNKCIYAIGGRSDVGPHSTIVECFDMTNKQWKDIAPLPEKFECASAVAFHGSILAYGKICGTWRWEILVYSPSTGKWVSKFIEQTQPIHSHLTLPFIFVHKDQCYRLRTSLPGERVVISQLTLRSLRSSTVSYVSLGEEILQDGVTPNNEGYFSIGEEMFVIGDERVHKIGMVKEDQDTEEFYSWQRMRPHLNLTCTNTVNFTCDIQR